MGGKIVALETQVAYTYPATQCLEHSLFNSTHHLFVFLDLLIAPSFALCAQPEVELCGVGVGIVGQDRQAGAYSDALLADQALCFRWQRWLPVAL